MQISENFTSEYEQKWEINFLQCYPNGLLRHTELCNLLQLTAAEHSEKGGMSYTEMQKNNQAWVLSKMRVEITDLPQWRDSITIKTWIVDMQGSRSVRAYSLYANGKKIIGGLTHWVVLNTTLRKSENLALSHTHFDIFPENIPTEKSFEKINIVQDTTNIISKKVLLSDLDIVNHVNNVKYLEWCFDYIQPEIILEQKIKAFDMNFLRELHLYDNIEIVKAISGNSEYYAVKKEGKNCFALQLELK